MGATASFSRTHKIQHKHPACAGLVTTIAKMDSAAASRLRAAQRKCKNRKCICAVIPVSLYSEANCVFISMAILDLLHRGARGKRFGLVEENEKSYVICANKIRHRFFKFLIDNRGFSRRDALRQLVDASKFNTAIKFTMLKHLAAMYDCCIEVRTGCKPQGRLHGVCRGNKDVFILNYTPGHVNAQFFIESLSEQQYLPAGFALFHVNAAADQKFVRSMLQIK